MVAPLDPHPLSNIWGDEPLHCADPDSVKGVGGVPPQINGAVTEIVLEVMEPEAFLATT